MVSQTKSNPSGFFINSLIHVPYVVEDLTHRHTDETKRNHRSDSVFHSTHRRSSNRE